jgi:predicted DNA-binding ribbon-helix-helix protein
MKKRSVRIARHSTSVSLEKEFWILLRHLAKENKCSLNQLIASIDATRTGNLSSALRLYVLKNLTLKR